MRGGVKIMITVQGNCIYCGQVMIHTPECPVTIILDYKHLVDKLNNKISERDKRIKELGKEIKDLKNRG